MNDVLEAVGLGKRFGSTAVLDDLNLRIAEGAVYGLIGPNGAGKSTLIKTLMNIYRPSSGVARIFGHATQQMTPADLARVGYVSENQELPDWMTVEYLMKYLRPFYPHWDDQRAEELLRQFDLPRTRALKHLSHGMRMKAALAAALAYRPALLVLDEPFTGLDPLVRDELIQALIEAMEDATVLISSHDLAEIESFASHIGYLERGRMQFSEELSSLTKRFRSMEITLGAPHVPPAKQWPQHWLQVEASSHAVRFIESNFENERTRAAVKQVFGETEACAAHAMPLREIFVALAKASRRAA